MGGANYLTVPRLLLIDVAATELTVIDGLELVAGDLRAVGLNVSLNVISPELWGDSCAKWGFSFSGMGNRR